MSRVCVRIPDGTTGSYRWMADGLNRCAERMWAMYGSVQEESLSMVSPDVKLESLPAAPPEVKFVDIAVRYIAKHEFDGFLSFELF